RYRKEATGSLDEVQIRNIEERHQYISELEGRRASILESIESQGKLTDDLKKKILSADTKAKLEDLYLPFKPKRRTKAMIARERGLEPLAERVLAQPLDGHPEEEAKAFVDPAKEVPDVEAALQGARDIVVETLYENADARALVREVFQKNGEVRSTYAKEPEGPTKFDQYGDFAEAIGKIPSHRFLAIRRGEKEGVLRVELAVELEAVRPKLEELMHINRRSSFASHLERAVKEGTLRLKISVETDVLVDLKLESDKSAVQVFAENLRNLLLAAPLGGKTVLGIDPGIRTGCKCVVVDDTGKFLENLTIYPSQGASKRQEAEAMLLALVHRHRPIAIAVGNGTAGRETETFVKTTLSSIPKEALAQMGNPFVLPVNEAGASVYSASDVARDEFPELDLTIRGAISIARRLQDPLAELVKIDPKSIGVGQYQHDVYQPMLTRKLDEVVESCVNHVGVELNTASAPLLAKVAGIGPSLAKKIVKHRDAHGAFKNRKELLNVSGLGPSTFEQCAGFLRVRGSDHPLDASAVHPERYPLVERMSDDLGVRLDKLIGDVTTIAKVDIKKYVAGDVGEPTLRDILNELKKPGRDPRDSFEPPRFRDDVSELEHLKIGMELEGVVTNVTAFGAFVDLGVHQDGLIHISQLSDRFVENPHDVVKPGDKIQVRVLEVDLQRRRIALTAKKGDFATLLAGRPGGTAPGELGTPSGPNRPGQGGARGKGGNPSPSRTPSTSGSGELKHNPFAALRNR
ncbi:MAG: Tex family protein, partial [Myxococcota bacterium]